MYFNRKNAEQKNWRMIKKGKHFLFGCSLVFAIGAALVAPSVKADTVEANPEAGSTTEEIKPVVAGDNVTYAAPAVEVAPSTPVAPAAVAEEKVETTQNSKEEPVVATEKAKEADSIQAPEVTVVYNPSALTDEEKAKVVAAVKAANSKATDVQVQADGSVVVTFADGSTASLSAAQTIKDGSQVAKPRRARAAVAAPVITSNLDGKGSSATDVTVQAPAGSTVKLYNSDGTVIGQAVANAQGVATVTPTNSLPVGEITATATPAGESESPKSAPVTATRPTLTTVEGGVSRGNDSDNTQLLVTKSHITVYPGESVKIGVVAVSKEMENFSVPKNPEGVKGLLPTGVYLKTAGTETYKRRDNGYGGTVAWDQPAGDTVVTFAVRSKNNVLVTRDLKVTVLELTKKLDAVPGEKVEVADLNNVSEDEKNKIIAATKKANASFPPGTLYNVDQRGNLVITYPDKSTDKIDASYLVTPSNKPADTNKPAGQAPEITSDLSGKASTPADVTVKAEPGSTVKLYNNDGVVIGEAVANDQGVATISPINSLPEGQITATATPAGGSESPKSTPITVTKTPLTEGEFRQQSAADLTLILSKNLVTVYPGDKIDIDVWADGTPSLEEFSVQNPYGVAGVKPRGHFFSKSGTDIFRDKRNKYSGTVAETQKAGPEDIGFLVRNKKGRQFTDVLRVVVLETAKKYEPVAGTKVDVADPNTLSEDEKNKIIDSVKTANPSLPANATYSVDEKGNLTITYPDGSKDKVAAAYLVTPVAKEADKYTPTAKAQTVAPGSTPDAKNSIDNTGELPSGTTFAYKTPVDTSTKGEKDAIVVVTYPDKSTDEVPVKVTVKDPRSDADKYDPKAKAQDIYKGSTPDAKGSIDNAGDLPYGTSFAYKTPVDTETPGEKDATVVVTYPDGSKDEVPVKVTVEDPDKTSAENNTPTAKDQTVKVGEKPKAEASIGNFDKLPKGTKAEFKTPVDTTTPGEKDAIVVVTYPDSLTYEVPVKVTVKDPRSDADKNDPKAKAQDVNKGETPDAKGSIDNASELPNGTTFAYKTPVDTETPGDKDAIVVVTYPDGSKDEVPVKVTVKDPRSDADKYTPVAKDQTVKPGDKPSAKDSIGNVGDLPSGTTFEFKTPVDTATEGDKDATVVVTYPDKSTDEVPVKVTVKDPRTDADKYTPVAKDQTVKPGDKPSAKDSIGNVGNLPSGTTFEFKTPVDTATDGEKDATVVVTYPDKSTDEVPVKVTVKDPRTDADKNTPVAKDQSVNKGETPDAKGSIGNFDKLPKGTTAEFKTPVDTATDGEKDATVVVTYPDKSTDEVPVKVTVKDPRTDADKNTPVAKDQSVNKGETPDAKGSIGNFDKLPKGTTAEFKTPVDTATDGEKDATVVVTYPDGSKDEVPVKVTVKDSSALTQPEITTDLTGKAGTKTPVEVTAEPGTKVELFDKDGNKIGEGTADNNGKVTITPTVDIPAGNVTAKATKDGQTSDASAPVQATKVSDKELKTPAITPVVNPSALTDAEKAKVAEEVKKANPTASKVEVGNDGTATVTFPDGSVAVLTPEKTVKEADSNGVKTPAITPVVNPSALTDAEKAKVAEEVKKANPTASKVEVGNDGTATVTFPDGSVAVLTPEKTVKEADSNGVKTPAITPVVNPSALTDAEKAKVAEEVKKANPTASKVEVGNDGTATVTFPDGSVAVLTPEKTVKEADSNGVKTPAITPVVNPSALTDAEKAKVAEEVKKANPTASKVEVGNDGTATVTFPDGSVAVLTPEKTVKEADSNGVKTPAITPVVNPSALTDAEKAKVAEEVKKANPTASKVEVGNDGTATVTFPDGSVAVLTPEKTVKEADSNGVKTPAITPVVNPSALTDAEKAKVADEVKKANPTASKVEVGNDGTATVTFPDGSVAVLTPEKTVKEADSNGVKTPAITPVVNPSALTDAEKAKVADEVKKANPTASKVEVGNDGTATVTFPDGSVAVLTPEKTVKEADSNGVKTPAITPVVNPSALTDAEKAKVADEVKKANPTASKVEVGNDGTATVTFPDGSVAVLTPEKTVKEADSNGVKTPAITPVVNPSALTDAEKAKVADEVKKANPTASKVEVGNDGTATVTFPDGSVAVLTPEKTVKEADSNGVKTPAITPVVNPSALTDAEKAKVAEEVKKANPTASKVEVGNDGTATVTFPDGSVAVLTPEKTVKEADSNGVKTPAITPVVNPSAITDAEKAKVAEEVKKANPTASKVEVGNDGTATVTFPDGSVAVLTPEKTVKEADSNGVKTPAITPVVNPSALTDAEKAKVADEVKKANPTASKVEVGNDGTATVTFPDGSVAVLTPEKTVKEADSNGVKTPAITPVVNPSALTDAEKAKVAEEVKKANPTAKDIKVNNDGSVVVTFADGSVAVLASENVVKEATKESPAQEPAKKAGAKELPNTGTKQSNSSLALALLAAVTGGLLIAKKREEEE